MQRITMPRQYLRYSVRIEHFKTIYFFAYEKLINLGLTGFFACGDKRATSDEVPFRASIVSISRKRRLINTDACYISSIGGPVKTRSVNFVRTIVAVLM